jgi:5,10-methylene-tetrahydrofolate dehydrogenase/methenyl tetrahydrofolate cyclohydrolase
VLVGSDPASEIYVRSKVKACEDIGVVSTRQKLTGDLSTDQLRSLIHDLNQNPGVDGILVQLPLPRQIDERQILLAVDPLKDVDGFHPMNSGNLMANRPGFRPCTPAGVMRLLEHYKIPIAGKHAVVVGRSDIVGKPMAMLLLHASATVTICHSKTADLAAECRRADILVAAIGRPAMIAPQFVQPGAVVGARPGGEHLCRLAKQVGSLRFGQQRAGRGCASGCVSVDLGVYARSRRRGPVDHRHADEQCGAERRVATRNLSRRSVKKTIGEQKKIRRLGGALIR